MWRPRYGWTDGLTKNERRPRLEVVDGVGVIIVIIIIIIIFVVVVVDVIIVFIGGS